MTTIETPCFWHFSRFPRSQSNPATVGSIRSNMIFVHANVNPSPSEVSGRNSVRRWSPRRGGNPVCRCVKNYETWGAVQCSAGSEDGIGVPEANGPYSLPRDEELDPCLERLCDACRYTMPASEKRPTANC
jgi:hypothetical protein